MLQESVDQLEEKLAQDRQTASLILRFEVLLIYVQSLAQRVGQFYERRDLRIAADAAGESAPLVAGNAATWLKRWSAKVDGLADGLQQGIVAERGM